MNIEEEKIKKELYNKGLEAFRKHEFYDAHEYWEDLWSDFNFSDRKFIQGLIQLAVSFVHLGNGNLTGAKNLLKKCQQKCSNVRTVYVCVRHNYNFMIPCLFHVKIFYTNSRSKRCN